MLLTDLCNDLIGEIIKYMPTYAIRCLSCANKHFNNISPINNILTRRTLEKKNYDILVNFVEQSYFNNIILAKATYDKLPEYGINWLLGPSIYHNNEASKIIEFAKYDISENITPYTKPTCYCGTFKCDVCEKVFSVDNLKSHAQNYEHVCKLYPKICKIINNYHFNENKHPPLRILNKFSTENFYIIKKSQCLNFIIFNN